MSDFNGGGLMMSGELFAGVGGLGMAVDAVFGSRPAWFAEVDKAPSKVLAHHYPDVPNLGDVTKIGVNNNAIENLHALTKDEHATLHAAEAALGGDAKEVPAVNVLSGGFP